MSSFIAAILKATVGLLVSKGRNVAAEKLKEGDVTDEQLRSLIVRELDDIKSKLEGLARKDLLASISFFKEGLVFLYKVKPNEYDHGKKTKQGEEREPLKQDDRSSEASVKTVSLAEEMRSWRLTDRDDSSARALTDAKDRFKQAREKATEAFCNEALSTSDRILAMQYRIMATILEKVDCLTDALASCKLCLEELHSMPAVKKGFGVQLKRGFKSRLHKTEREDTIRSVCRMNRVVFSVILMTGEDADVSLWPCVDFEETEKVDPLRDRRVTISLQTEDPEYLILKAWPFYLEDEKMMVLKDWFMTTNTKGQLIIVATDHQCTLLKAFDRNGNQLQSVRLMLPLTKSAYPSSRVIHDIASDRDSNVLLLVDRIQLNGDYKCTVIVFDQHAKFQLEFDLNEGSHGTRITVSEDNKVFVAVRVGENTEVQMYNSDGLFLNSIGNGTLNPITDLAATDLQGSKIMVLGSRSTFFFSRRFIIYEFSEEGHLLSRLDPASSDGSCICYLHKTEHVAVCIYKSSFFRNLPESLQLYNKEGKLVRRIELYESGESLFDSPFYINSEAVIVTKEGLVAMLATDKITDKKMIIIL